MGNTLSKFAKGEPGLAALNAQPTERVGARPVESPNGAARERTARLTALPAATGLQRAPARPAAAGGVATGVVASTRVVAGSPVAPALAHWAGLVPGRAREYAAEVYDTSIVKRVFPHEIHSWEHQKTTAALLDLAKHDAWEAHAVPPIELAYSEEGVSEGGRTLHYAITDGHHRLNAARRVSAGVPAMVTRRWVRGADGHYSDSRRVPHTVYDASAPRAWNRCGKPQIIHAPEGVEQANVWGTQQLTVSLPGSALGLSLVDIAARLNAFKRPEEFLNKAAGDLIRVRVTLQDVYRREDASSKQGDLKADLQFAVMDHGAKDWKAIFGDARPLKTHFASYATSRYPILVVQVQQSRYSFIADDL